MRTYLVQIRADDPFKLYEHVTLISEVDENKARDATLRNLPHTFEGRTLILEMREVYPTDTWMWDIPANPIAYRFQIRRGRFPRFQRLAPDGATPEEFETMLQTISVLSTK